MDKYFHGVTTKKCLKLEVNSCSDDKIELILMYKKTEENTL